MTRELLLRPERIDEQDNIKRLAEFYSRKGLSLHIDRVLLLWEHHFDAFVNGYPVTGYKKRGTILYRSGKIRVPRGRELLAYVSSEHDAGLPPRGIVTIDYAVRCPLNEITEEEWLNDGFMDQKDLLWQMTRMEGRYYQDLTPWTNVSYYAFSDYEPDPSPEKVKQLLEIANTAIL